MNFNKAVSLQNNTFRFSMFYGHDKYGGFGMFTCFNFSWSSLSPIIDSVDNVFVFHRQINMMTFSTYLFGSILVILYACNYLITFIGFFIVI